MNKKTNKKPWKTDEIKAMCQHIKNLYFLVGGTALI
jgi:hypothetical protein